MTHIMSLSHEPFLRISDHRKNIEIRLFDERRQNIKIDDEIEFIDLETNQTITKVVQDLKVYPDFISLYQDNDKKALGYLDDETANPSDMDAFYTKERQNQYQALAIYLK